MTSSSSNVKTVKKPLYKVEKQSETMIESHAIDVLLNQGGKRETETTAIFPRICFLDVNTSNESFLTKKQDKSSKVVA